MTIHFSIQIRPYQFSDAVQVEQLFCDTVRAIIRRDYTEKQVEIWVEQGKINQISRPLEKNYVYVAEIDDRIVGFADLTSEGYLDRLYVRKGFQRCGVAGKLLDVLESKARSLHLGEITIQQNRSF